MAGGACFFYGTPPATSSAEGGAEAKLGICRQFSGGGAGNRELCTGLAGVYQKVEYMADRGCPKQPDYVGECRGLTYSGVAYTQYYYNWPANLAKEDAERVCGMRSGGQFAFDPAMAGQ